MEHLAKEGFVELGAVDPKVLPGGGAVRSETDPHYKQEDLKLHGRRA